MHIHIYALCYIIHYIHVYVHTCMYILRFPPPPSPSLRRELYFSSERVFFVFTRVRHSISLARSCTFVSSRFISLSIFRGIDVFFLIFFSPLLFITIPSITPSFFHIFSLSRSFSFLRISHAIRHLTHSQYFSFFLFSFHRLSICIINIIFPK